MEYGESWYQGAEDDQQMEYLDARQSEYLSEEEMENGFTSVDHDGGHGHRERLAGLDTAALAENLRIGADGSTAYDDGGNVPNIPVPPLPVHTRLSLYNTNNADASDVKTGPVPRGTFNQGRSKSSSVDLFTPPVNFASQRPETEFAQAESFDSSNFYNNYDDSTRPNTNHDPRETIMSTVPMTPATSSLLPWLKKDQANRVQLHLSHPSLLLRERQRQETQCHVLQSLDDQLPHR